MSEQKGPEGGEDHPLEPRGASEGEIVEDEESDGLVFHAEAFGYQGAIPPPEWMEYYNRIVPGSAKQMIDDMHDQSAHRRDIERDEAQAGIVLAKRGQVFGFVTAVAGFLIVMTAIIGGLALVYSGRSLGAGLALTLVGLAALAAVFVANRFAARPPHQLTPPEDPVTVRKEPPQSS